MAVMTSRERAMRALNHRAPDRVPIDFGGLHTSLHSSAYRKLREYLGLGKEEIKIFDPFQQIVLPGEDLRVRFGADVRGFFPDPPDNWKFKIDPEENTYVDEWGIKYGMPEGGLYYDIYQPPLQEATLEEIKKFKFPNPHNPGRVRDLKKKYKELYENTSYALIIYCPTGGVFEHSYFLRGIEQLYLDMSSDLRLIDYLAGRLSEWQIDFWENILEAIGDYVQIVQVGDDLGHQNGLLFSPRIYRKYYKKREEAVISTIKKMTGAKVYFHSCGAIRQVIPDLIEIGIDILNPVQISARDMDSGELKREFGRVITFWGGGCDPQNVLPYGTPNDVREEVKRRINDFASGGGFVFAPVHNIQANVPPENIVTFFDTALEEGKY